MPTILIIDDDWMNIELAQIFLEREGFDVITATSANRGIEAAIRQRPAAILCDVRLGTESGYDVCAAIKGNPETAAIPVIMLTAYEKAEERQKAEEAGADDFISKTGNMPVVIQRIRGLVSA
ncbi:MAG: response regulator [Anaerolinea sp.]|nr:response regulator [Anaerolinea sp.]